MSGNFIDSNVLICLFSKSEPEKRATATQLVEAQLTGEGVISFQVVQEALNVIGGKMKDNLSPSDRREFLASVLMPLWKVMPSETLYREALDIQDRYGYSFCDSLIIAAAMAAGCTRLYSEDLKHGQRFGRLAIINPFLD